MLDCGHEYHVACIKKWLSKKNSCPICKKTTLTTRDWIPQPHQNSGPCWFRAGFTWSSLSVAASCWHYLVSSVTVYEKDTLPEYFFCYNETETLPVDSFTKSTSLSFHNKFMISMLSGRHWPQLWRTVTKRPLKGNGYHINYCSFRFWLTSYFATIWIHR